MIMTVLGFINFSNIVLGQEIASQPVDNDVAASANIPSTNGTDIAITGGTLATTIGAAAGLYLKDKKDKKDVTTDFYTEFRALAENVNEYIALQTKLHNYAYVYKNYTYAQILDLPATVNPLDKTPIGQALTTQANKIINKAMQDYNVPRPQMSIASQSIVSAAQNNPPAPTQQAIKPNTPTAPAAAAAVTSSTPPPKP